MTLRDVQEKEGCRGRESQIPLKTVILLKRIVIGKAENN